MTSITWYWWFILCMTLLPEGFMWRGVPLSSVRLRKFIHAGQSQNWLDISPQSDGSVLKRTIRVGNSHHERAVRFDDVSISWKMHSTNGTLINTSTDLERQTGEYFSFKIGMTPSEVIPGWEVALSSMFVGEIAEVILAPHQAFGSSGLVGLVAANESLRCELHLRHIEPFITRVYPVERADRAEQVHDEFLAGFRSGEISTDHLPMGPSDAEGAEDTSSSISTTSDVIDTVDLSAPPPPPPLQPEEPKARPAPSQPSRKFFDPRLHHIDTEMQLRGEGQGHHWEETRSSIDLYVPLPTNTVSPSAADVIVDVRSRYLSVTLRSTATLSHSDEVLFAGALHGKVAVSEVAWAVEEGTNPQNGERCWVVHLSLPKTHGSADYWATVLAMPSSSPTSTADQQAH